MLEQLEYIIGMQAKPMAIFVGFFFHGLLFALTRSMPVREVLLVLRSLFFPFLALFVHSTTLNFYISNEWHHRFLPLAQWIYYILTCQKRKAMSSYIYVKLGKSL